QNTSMDKKNRQKIEKTGNVIRPGKEVVSVENRETKSEIWFSHEEDIWNAELKGTQKVFYWTGQSQMWDWDNCTVSWQPKDRNSTNTTIRVVIRSLRTVFSDYRKKNVKLRYMRGFDIDGSTIQRPREEKHREPTSNKPKTYGEERIRWAFSLDSNHTIWQWKEEDSAIEASKLFEIYSGILKSIEESINPDANEIFNVVAYDDNEIGKAIVPVIYQPAIDSWKNFIREIHCHAQDHGRKIEVSLLFNNEELRKHKIANRIYEWFRSWFYGRLIDVETFHILLNDSSNNAAERLDFEKIYSGENGIQQDSIHLDKRGINVKYYFGNFRHPIIFINTSNHAMAEHDANHELWKWEYVAWQEDGAVEFHRKSRKKIDDSFKPKLRFW
ncbi:MAG: hypothetical protein ACJ71B_11890, partial [Nitrososphaera sp.]